jgi:hypothetical protein
MRARINFWPNFDQLRDTFASFHLGIILKACYGFKATNYAGNRYGSNGFAAQSPPAIENTLRQARVWLASRNVSPES